MMNIVYKRVDEIILGVVFIVRKSSPASKKLETTANC